MLNIQLVHTGFPYCISFPQAKFCCCKMGCVFGEQDWGREHYFSHVKIFCWLESCFPLYFSLALSCLRIMPSAGLMATLSSRLTSESCQFWIHRGICIDAFPQGSEVKAEPATSSVTGVQQFILSPEPGRCWDELNCKGKLPRQCSRSTVLFFKQSAWFFTWNGLMHIALL